MEGRPLRLFFGLPLPGDLREALGRWQWGQAHRQGWSRPEGLHLTLAFLGLRPPEGVPSLETIASTVARRHGAFEVRTTQLGGFPGGRSTRLLWLGLEASPPLEALAADLREALEAGGEAFDSKPFHPHVTLARFRRTHPLAAFVPPPPAAFAVDRLVLFESRPEGGYAALRTWPLRAV